jgi:putative ABC transport system permease protein
MTAFGNPLWRKAPLALRRFPGILAALVAGAALLALAASASPLFVSASASAALADELEDVTVFGAGQSVRTTGRVVPLDSGHVREASFGERTAALEDALSPLPHLGGLVTTVLGPDVAAAGPRRDAGELRVRLLARTGALDHVRRLAGRAGDGVWLADTTATDLGVGAGDEVRLGLGTTPRTATVRVDGVYRSLHLEPPTPFWRSLGQDIYPRPPAFATPPTFAIGAEDTVVALARRLRLDRVDYGWEAPLETARLTLPQAERLAGELGRFGRRLATPGSDLERLFACVGCFRARPVESSSRLPAAVGAARATAATVLGPIDLLANAGALVALAVVAAVAVFSLARRRVEAALLFSRGVGPTSVAARSALEAVLPVGAGTALGFGLAYVLVRAVGPDGAIDPETVVDAARAAAVRAPIAVGLLALVATAAFFRRFRPGPGHTRRLPPIPWEVAALAVAAFCLARLLRDDAFVPVGRDDVPQPSAYLMLFPIALLAAGGGLGARILRRAVRAWRARSARSESEAGYLASRRLAASGPLVVLLVTACAVALGMFVYAETVVASYSATVRASSLLATGSDVQGLTSFDRPIPRDVAFPVTKVTKLYSSGTITLDGAPVDVMALDPPTFARAAFWDDRYAPRPLAQIVDELASPSDGALAVALVAGSRTAAGPLELGGEAVPITVVERPRAFPGMSRRRPLVVAAEAPLLAAIARAGVANPLDDPAAFTELWARGETERTARLLASSEARPFPLTTAAEARSRPEVTAFTRTFAFLEALGLAAGLLAVVGLVVYLQVRQRGRVVAFGLARRMGLARRAHLGALALELGLSLAAALAIGLVLALAAARLVLTEVEPLASISPVPLFEAPVPLAALACAALAVVALLGAVLANRAAERASLAEVLRLGE